MGLPAGAGALVGKRLGRYDLVALLAVGGTAEVYLARMDGEGGFEKYVVVKCLHDHLAEDEQFVSMFLDEARLGAQLDHTNIVQTLGLGEQDGRYYLVMEFLAGLSLALVGRRAHERVRGGRVPVPLVLNVAAQACAGLHYAHERAEGLVHRDISPQNLVITFEGLVKLVDFGIAKADVRQTRTQSGTVKGKFAYMSPEQCQAQAVDRRTDVFAMGVIVWELLTGRRLFKRDSTYETYQAVVSCNVSPPSAVNHELDPALDAIVMRALAKDPARRYPTAEAFGEALVGYLHHRGKASGPGELARFFDESFSTEADEHAGRMRELMEGRRQAVADAQLQWDANELDGPASELDDADLEELLDDAAASIRSANQPRALTATSGEIGGARASTAPGPGLRPVGGQLDDAPQTTALGPAGRGARRAPAPARLDDDPDGATRMDNPLEALAVPSRGDAAAPARPALPSPGLRASGAPLDPLPHERAAGAAAPGAAIPAPPRPGFRDAPTVLAADAPPAPLAAPRPGFRDAKTVLAAEAAPAPAAAPRPGFRDAPTVLAANPAPAPSAAPRPGFRDAPTVLAANPAQAPGEPGGELTQMLSSSDLLAEEAPGAPAGPSIEVAAAAFGSGPYPAAGSGAYPPAPALDVVGLPPVAQLYPDNAYYQQVAAGAPTRRLPPWLLAALFVGVLAATTGLIVLLARALR